ncbi:MAG: hypothetical protein Q9M89_00805 [Persephonella sp.]|nr:hypothetical protein [Persephonella sp.]
MFFKSISIIGSGSWGTALAQVFSEKFENVNLYRGRSLRKLLVVLIEKKKTENI